MTEQNRMLASLFPLIVSILAIGVILIFSFVFRLYEYPFWIGEGGVIEALSALGYFLCAALMILKGRLAYIKQYHYFFILMVFFGLRELDFDKEFTSKGILTSELYLSNNVPAIEKWIGLLIIAILLYSIISVIKNHSRSLFHNIKRLSPVHIGASLTLFFLVFVKAIDGIGRKLSDVNIHIEEQTAVYFEATEEILELLIPLLILSTLLIYFSAEKRDK